MTTYSLIDHDCDIDRPERFATRDDALAQLRAEAIKSLTDPDSFIGDPECDTCTEDDIQDYIDGFEIVAHLDVHAVLPLAR